VWGDRPVSLVGFGGLGLVADFGQQIIKAFTHLDLLGGSSGGHGCWTAMR
jgi:hypothetical protein